MDLRKYFPFSDSVVPNDTKSLAASLLIYIVATLVLRVVSFVFGWLILIGEIISILSTLIGLYCVVGIILSIMIYFKIV